MSLSPDAARSALRRELFLLGAAALLVGSAILADRFISDPLWRFLRYAAYFGAYLLAGWNVLSAAGRGILHGRFLGESFLMTIATVGAFIIGQLPEAVAVMVFYKVGEILQQQAVGASRRSIQRVLDLRPDSARVARNGGFIEVRPEEVAVGERILVRPGERIPLDGIVISGEGYADTAAITGEPVPRRVRPGQELLAGYISTDGSIEMTVSRLSADSGTAQIVRMVQGASKAKARTEQFITRFARVYTPIVVLAAAGIAFLPPLLVPGASLASWVSRALTMLVISCPCALVISIPLGYFGGVGGAARHGVLVKGALYLDVLAGVRTVVFDKTGTLTQGVFEVQSVVPRYGVSAPDLLRYAAHAEAHSNHPIAASIRRAYALPVDGASSADYREVGGQGVFAQVDGHAVMAGNDRLLHEHAIAHDLCSVEGTAVHVVVDGHYAGYLAIGDTARPDAAAAVAGLRSLGVTHTALLTGDDAAVAARTARFLGIDEAHGDLLPQEKVSRLERIMAERRGKGGTAFVGDGINDAPVLARADVGVALGGNAADAAVETADVVLMADTPLALVAAIRRARATRAIVFQNIVLALGVKGVFLALGAFGVTTMWEAVIADMGVALAAILNATRVMR